MMKTCIKCGETKELTEFYKSKKNKDGYRGRCISCYRKHSICDKDKLKEYKKQYYLKNKVHLSEIQKKYEHENRDRINENHRKWVEKNPGRRKEICHKSYLKNKESYLEYGKKWREENSERMTYLRKRWKDANKDRILECGRERDKKNPDKRRDIGRRWAKNNPDKINAKCAKRRLTIEQQCPSWANLDKIREFYTVAKQLTETHGNNFEVDHIIPLRGKYVTGLHVEINLQIITRIANIRKGNRFDVLGRF